MRAALGHGAALQHEDLVGVRHRAEAVRDADGRAPHCGRLQRVQDGLRDHPGVTYDALMIIMYYH